MARYMVATHNATITRDWLCGHCQAFGRVSVEAEGEGEKRLWFSRAAAADVAHERAAVALERDADRIISLVRCPKCHERARGATLATLWHGLGDFAAAFVCSVFIGVLAVTYLGSSFVGVVLAVAALVVVLALGKERRRWAAAGRADLQVVRVRAAPVQSAPIVRPSQPVTADPYRALPAPPPLDVVRPAIVVANAPIVPSVDADARQPTFLV